MKNRKMTPSGDYTFGNSTNGFYTDAVAIAQAIKTRLGLIEGEWWENALLGIPLFTNILGQPGTDDVLESVRLIIIDEILGTQGVQSIVDFTPSFSSEDRKYSAQCVVETIYGQVELEVTF